MTTQSWSTRIRHDSDATFREWGSELNARLAAAGLVQTGDTGQVDWATVTRPAINALGGYEIWRMNDALQATAPVFFRIEYRTFGAVDWPGIRIQVGTATNGSGTLSGTCLSASNPINGFASQISDTARQSYLCVTDGFFGLSWKTAAGVSEGSFLFARTVDNDGDATAVGAAIRWGAGSATAITGSQVMRYAATAEAYTLRTAVVDAAFSINPQARATSVVNGVDPQAFIAWIPTPAVAPLVGFCGLLDAEVSAGSTFTATLVGTTPRTYIGLTPAAGPAGPLGVTSTGGLKFGMLWE